MVQDCLGRSSIVASLPQLGDFCHTPAIFASSRPFRCARVHAKGLAAVSCFSRHFKADLQGRGALTETISKARFNGSQRSAFSWAVVCKLYVLTYPCNQERTHLSHATSTSKIDEASYDPRAGMWLLWQLQLLSHLAHDSAHPASTRLSAESHTARATELLDIAGYKHIQLFCTASGSKARSSTADSIRVPRVQSETITDRSVCVHSWHTAINLLRQSCTVCAAAAKTLAAW